VSVIVISVDGIPITDDVLLAGASFTSLVNGRPGQCSFKVLDREHTRAYDTGASIELSIDGTTIWGGYVRRVRSVFPLSVMDTTKSPAIVPRIWAIEGVDWNILFQERVVFKPSDPIGKTSFNYSVDTYDDTIINDIFDNYLDISTDGLTRTGVERIAKAILDVPNVTHRKGASIVSAGSPWDIAMREVASATGGVYYISPDKDLHYVDAGAVTSTYTLTDVPGVGGGGGTTSTKYWFRSSTLPGGYWQPAGYPKELLLTPIGSPNYFAYDTPTVAGPTAPIQIVDNNGPVDWLTPYLPVGDFSGVADLSVWFGEWPASSNATFTVEIYMTSATGDAILWGSHSIGTEVTTSAAAYTFQITGTPYTIPEADQWRAMVRIFTDDADAKTMGTGTASFYIEGDVDGFEDSWITFVTNNGGGPSTDVGYQSFSIVEDGTNLINDMIIWGSGMGSPNYVYARTQDSASITAHNRWQAGLNTAGIWRQTTAAIVSDSYVYGTPQSLRGGKDDAVSFICRVFEPVFQVGEIVPIVCSIFGFTRSLPIRRMQTTFASPTEPIFDLTLSHSIDLPIGIFEQTPIPQLPPPPPKPPELPPPVVPLPTEACGAVVMDSFNRTMTLEDPATSSWGTSTDGEGGVWTVDWIDAGMSQAIDGSDLILSFLGPTPSPAGNPPFTVGIGGILGVSGSNRLRARFQVTAASGSSFSWASNTYYPNMGVGFRVGLVWCSYTVWSNGTPGSYVSIDNNDGASHTINANTWYWLEGWVDIDADIYRARVFEDGTSPSTWDVEVAIGYDETSPSTSSPNLYADHGFMLPGDTWEVRFSDFQQCRYVAPVSVPESGKVCQTVAHAGGTSFTALHNFAQFSLEVYINGTREMNFTSSGTDRTIELSAAISADDVLYICYEALPNLYGAPS